MENNQENEEVKALIRKRGSLKAKLTIFEKYLKSFESMQVSIESVERSKVIELEQRIQDTESLLVTFDELQSEIECGLDDFEGQYTEREGFNNRFYSVLAEAKTVYEKFSPQIDNNSVARSHLSSNQGSLTDHSIGVKLPEIKLPKFDGSFQTWLDFRDIFASLIHNNVKLNEIQKFHYLRASLIGSATQVIQAIEFCATNYIIAWDTLCERFNNTNLLIQNHINAIFNMEPIAVESAMKIRNLSDDLFKHLTSLKQLGEPTEYWDTLVIYVVSSKLDNNTEREWERLKAKQRISCTFEYFKKFLKERADLLENMEMNFNKNRIGSPSVNRDNRQFPRDGKRGGTRSLYANVQENDKPNNDYKSNYSCLLCKGDHSLFYCSDLLKLSINDRISKIKDMQLCSNCLRRNHLPKDCNWSGCKLCGQKHNTILHGIKEKTNSTVTVTQISENSDLSNDLSQNAGCNFAIAQNAILCTARVQVRDVTGNFITARALLDCGSQSSFVTSELCDKLKIPRVKTDLTITGISDKMTRATYKCNLTLHSITNTFSFNLTCFVLDKITNDLPNMFINRKKLNIPAHIKLADSEFEKPQTIELLIGADAFWNILGVGKINLGSGGTMLQNTRLGWIVAGPLASSFNTSVCNFSKNVALQDQLTKFWEIEEISNNKPLSAEETLCEKHFIDNLTLSPEGRYVVSLPLKDSADKLGSSREIAVKRLVNLERKLHSNETLRSLYIDFLREYERLGHMTEINDENNTNKPEYFLPHHGVLKKTSSTTKLRVVFNASSPSSSGLSLNDLQMTGPTIQSDLLSIILRFRMRNIVLSSDIKMMYRQVLINSEQRDLQKIVWRWNPDEPIKTFRLNTVTYGTTAGSFLAIRCLHEVANECTLEYPKIANIIKRDMYVDDLLASVDSLDDAKYIVKKLSEVFLRRGFELRKWKSNHSEAISDLSPESENMIEFSINKDQESKTLGLLWSSDQDILTYKLSPITRTEHNKITKRVILSIIATIFDPLGLVSPCVILAKVLLQRLWHENLTWDQPLPNSILNIWLEFSSELQILNTISIPRKVTCERPIYIALHGFSDASESSYGACVYVLSKNSDRVRESNLLSAKSKVAPLKSLTMPRLELCASLVLSQLISKILESIDIEFNDVYCWTDSTIVLGWLQTSPNLLKPFIDNRVAEIQKLTNSFKWKHVPTKENPADLVSRGVRPKHLIDSEIWWHGPKWLLKDQKQWPTTEIVTNDLPEMRKSAFVVTASKTIFPFDKFSDLIHLKRTVAFMFRFVTNLRNPLETRKLSYLTVNEINNSFHKLIKIAQLDSFPEEVSILNSKNELSSQSRLLSLHPFLDDQGLLRVGGRLANSDYSYSKKYPILLSPHHYLTRLIMEFEHKNLLHGGPQLLLSTVRENYWPISGRNLARKVVRSCVQCSRYNPHNVQPIMGNLPVARVQSALPFVKVGLD